MFWAAFGELSFSQGLSRCGYRSGFHLSHLQTISVLDVLIFPSNDSHVVLSTCILPGTVIGVLRVLSHLLTL